jgi:hypothetical protein
MSMRTLCYHGGTARKARCGDWIESKRFQRPLDAYGADVRSSLVCQAQSASEKLLAALIRLQEQAFQNASPDAANLAA